MTIKSPHVGTEAPLIPQVGAGLQALEGELFSEWWYVELFMCIVDVDVYVV